MLKIPIRDVSLFVKVTGRGYPLLLMHGGPGADHSTMLPFRPLAERFTLIFYDHRCNGRSQGADVTSMTWDNLTADADALRRELGFDRWAVLGHSFGGMVALEYALRYPHNLSHLLLVDTCGDARWAQQNAPDVLAQRGYSDAAVQAARRFFNGRLTPHAFLPTMLKFGRAYYYRPSLSKLLPGFRVKVRPEAQIYAFGHLLPGWTVMDRLGDIKTPTLVLAGRDDFQFPPEHQEELAAGIPDARLHIIDHCGHNAPQERPAAVIEAVSGFLS